MTESDPLAAERFRTILMGPIEAEADRIYEGGVSYADDAVVDELTGKFSDAHFERTTNEHGVRMRRVVVASEWEVDPTPAVKNEQEPCDTCSGMGCAECAPLAADGKPWLNPLDENETASYYDRMAGR